MALDVEPLEAARRRLGLSHRTVWHAYFGLGGSCSPAIIESYLGGGPDVSASQHDVLVHALNEVFLDRDMNHPLGYSRP